MKNKKLFTWHFKFIGRSNRNCEIPANFFIIMFFKYIPASALSSFWEILHLLPKSILIQYNFRKQVLAYNFPQDSAGVKFVCKVWIFPCPMIVVPHTRTVMHFKITPNGPCIWSDRQWWIYFLTSQNIYSTCQKHTNS